ncbi:MAG: hypothetical protein K8953_01330, partial [Proteobacteria bacterium]|nr:hypothetical protein [Pseudomonadota bacterium]
QSNANAAEGQNGYAYYITNDNDGNIAYSYAGILDTTNVGLSLHSLDSPIATWRGEWSLNGVKPNTSNPSDDFILRVDYSGLHISGIGTKEIDGIDHTINVLGRYSVAGVIINGQADLIRSNVLYKGSLIGLIGHELAVGAFRSSDSDVSFAGGFIANPPAVDPVPYQNQSQRVFFPEIPVVDPLPDNGVLQADVQLATTAFLTQTEGDNLETGINFDTINNQAGESGIIGRLREIVQPEVPKGYFPVLFTPRVAQKAVSKGVDFNLVSFKMFSGTESLNDKDFVFMGFGYDGVFSNSIKPSYRFVGYAGYNLASIEAPSVPTTTTAIYRGRLGVIAVSNNMATEELLNAENRVNATINISLRADFSAGTIKSTHTTYLIEAINSGSLGRVVVNGTFATGDTALGGTVDFFLPSIFTRDNDALISTTLQGVIDRNLAIGAFHGADASVAIVGGFIARSPSN